MMAGAVRAVPRCIAGGRIVAIPVADEVRNRHHPGILGTEFGQVVRRACDHHADTQQAHEQQASCEPPRAAHGLQAEGQ